MDPMIVASTNKNAEHCVREALVHDIYTMLLTTTSLTDSVVLRMKAATEIAIRQYHAEDRLRIAVRKCRSTVTDRNRGVALIVYNQNRPNPYLTYGFRDKTIIIRDNRRLMEQTIQLIYDAKEHRNELNDMFIHTCVTMQHHKRKYLIIICRGTDSCQRSFFQNGKKRPLHSTNQPVDEPKVNIYDKYMREHLQRFGNTVADPKFIRRFGVAKTERFLTDAIGMEVRIRFVSDISGEYYIAETEEFWRNK